ncbi:hypothetical protein IAD21_01228 [Abditibacteriota bacterium]|nr:hypothetical protein IAD21_01228 [Abditibacteriota bacterium]
MEFEVLSEEIEREARRLVAAFGIADWKPMPTLFASWVVHFEIKIKETFIEWAFLTAGSHLSFLYVGQRKDEYEGCYLRRSEDGDWLYRPDRHYNELMARGLYRFGFEDEAVLAVLPTLSMHEKLEARLSLPREFWPQKWLDEETM